MPSSGMSILLWGVEYILTAGMPCLSAVIQGHPMGNLFLWFVHCVFREAKWHWNISTIVKDISSNIENKNCIQCEWSKVCFVFVFSKCKWISEDTKSWYKTFFFQTGVKKKSKTPTLVEEGLHETFNRLVPGDKVEGLNGYFHVIINLLWERLSQVMQVVESLLQWHRKEERQFITRLLWMIGH